MPKRTYKLTKEEKAKAKILYAKGYTKHGALSKKLGVSRQKVSNWLKERKLGKRRPSKFWGDVKSLQRLEEMGWKEARKAVRETPYWARKRAARQGKEYKSYSDFWKEWKEKWKYATEAERDAHGYEATYGEEGEFVGGTPF